MEKRLLLPLILAFSMVALLVLPPGAAGVASAVPVRAAQAEPAPAESATPEPSPPVGTGTAGEEGEAAPTPTGLLEEIAPTRTPEPTITPGVVMEEVERLIEAAGLSDTSILGLRVADWINLAYSLVMVLAGYLIGTWLIRRVLPRAARRTSTDFDERLLQTAGNDVRWLVVLITMHLATIRLLFVSPELKAFLRDAYAVVGLLLGTRIAWKLISLGDEWARERAVEEGRESQLEPLIVLLSRVGRVVVVLVSVIVLLSYFGVNVTALTAALGLGGLALSLAAQDTIADAIAGFIILVDQPFRIGDRIEIQDVGTWGDVVDIGLRTTRIRTRDNRMVIVPNSTISKNQVVNYTFPDPQYRIETHVGIDYRTDIERARQVIIDAVRQVDGVLPDRPVDALYVEMGDSAMIFRVRWWIESYVDTRRMFDKVHTVLQYALDEAGIECPFPTQSLNLQMEPDTARRISRAFQENDGTGREEVKDE
jgi:small-conductance mechanosensitive channel